MKERIPRKLKKGLHSLLKRRDTKWKRKAENIAQRAIQGVALRFAGSGSVSFELSRQTGLRRKPKGKIERFSLNFHEL